MKYTVKREEQIVWSNTDIRHFFSLTEFFRCTVPIETVFNLSSILLYFEIKDVSPEDTLEVCFFCCDKDRLYYIVKLSDIPQGVPLKLEVENNLLCKDFINLSIKYNATGKGSVAIGINEKGPCIAIVGRTIEEYFIEYEPKISIVTPVYNTNLEYFKKTYESVINQVYTNWEWVIVEDCSKNKAIKTFLKTIKHKDIKIFYNNKNEGIVKTSNRGIGKATGKYVAFLDDNDLLSPDALISVVEAIDKNKNLKLIYSDEDKLTADDKYVDQFFKPDWSYDLLLSQNYVCHLGVYQASLLHRIGGLDKSYEGSQDYSLTLTFSEYIAADEVHHIPKILYHWRKEEGSSSSCITNKPYAHLSALLAIKAHLGRKGYLDATVTVGKYVGTYRVDYCLEKKPKINIIIPTRDNPVYLETCMHSLFQSSYKNYVVTIVNNRSNKKDTLGLLTDLSSVPNVKVYDYDKPFNYSAINNFAVKKSEHAEIYLFLNDDTEVITRDWMETLLQHIGKNNVAVAGPKLLYGDNRIQHAGVIIGIGGVAGHSHKHAPDGMPGYFSRPHLTQNVSAVTGACMMIDAIVFHKVGGFEEKLPKAFNDIDLCLKVRKAGYNIVCNPHACLYHHESISRGLDNHKETEFAKAIEYMQKKWDCKNFKDPYYNPNLTLIDENFSYKIG